MRSLRSMGEAGCLGGAEAHLPPAGRIRGGSCRWCTPARKSIAACRWPAAATRCLASAAECSLTPPYPPTHCLPPPERDNGWIHTLLEEAENERMHLLTFMVRAGCVAVCVGGVKRRRAERMADAKQDSDLRISLISGAACIDAVISLF